MKTCENCIHNKICLFQVNTPNITKCPSFKTANLVEIIRCKDCKWYRISYLECIHPRFNGIISHEGFCSYGERKEERRMKNYNYEKIDKLIQPLMTMMQEEYPNGFKLIIEPHFARIVYEHDEKLFQSDEMKKPLGETIG